MDLEPIRDFIASNTDLRAGRTLFLYSGPAALDRYVLLLSELGVGGRVDYEIPRRLEDRFQVIVRDSAPDAARKRANQLFDLLSLEGVRDFGLYTTSYVRPLQSPILYRRSDGDLVEASINFTTLYTRAV